MSSSTPTGVFLSPTARIAGVAMAVVASAVVALGACAPGPSVTPSPEESSTQAPRSRPSSSSDASPAAARLRYVALGDSYTIGTSVTEAERWPNQLVTQIGPGYPELELAANLAVNGFTSRDVIEAELPALASLRPDFVSLLIGVNDVVQGVPEDVYRANVVLILDDLRARVEPARIVVVTIPDYTVTPAGADFGDIALRSARIRRFNAIMEELTRARSIALVDIYDVSLGAASDRSLVSVDGLHPSGAQYRRWVERIKVAVEDQLAP